MGARSISNNCVVGGVTIFSFVGFRRSDPPTRFGGIVVDTVHVCLPFGAYSGCLTHKSSSASITVSFALNEKYVVIESSFTFLDFSESEVGTSLYFGCSSSRGGHSH